MAMSSEQQIRAMAVDTAARLVAAGGPVSAAQESALFTKADTIANYIAGYDISARAEEIEKTRRGW
jgi:hypothetical protein